MVEIAAVMVVELAFAARVGAFVSVTVVVMVVVTLAAYIGSWASALMVARRRHCLSLGRTLAHEADYDLEERDSMVVSQRLAVGDLGMAYRPFAASPSCVGSLLGLHFSVVLVTEALAAAAAVAGDAA